KDQQVSILGPKHRSEDDEFVFKNIQQQKGLPVYFYEWPSKQNRQQNIREIGPPVVEFPLWLARVNPFSFSIIPDGSYRIPKPFILINYFSFRAHNAPLLLYCSFATA